MYFNWNEDTIRWYINAEKHTRFYKNLAEELVPMLSGCRTLCDVGCGAALFDFEIAPFIASIDCVDINEIALSSIEDRAKELGLNHLHTQLSDSETLTGKWDVVFMSFFGSRDLDCYLPLCKKLIAVVGTEADAPLFPRRDRGFARNTVENTAAYLDGKGIAYRLTRRELEFGQPFTSIEDAAQFIRTYAPYATDEEAGAFLAQRLVQTENPEYPYYIPRMKSVGIFELEGKIGCA